MWTCCSYVHCAQQLGRQEITYMMWGIGCFIRKDTRMYPPDSKQFTATHEMSQLPSLHMENNYNQCWICYQLQGMAGKLWKMSLHLQPVLMTKEPAPWKLVELAACHCQRSAFKRTNCTWRRNIMTYTEACVASLACVADESWQNPRTWIDQWWRR